MNSYGALCTEFYDLDKPTAPELALEWYARKLPPGRVLEPMCGSGRFLVPLIEQGRQVDGFDPSAPMLNACRAKLQTAGFASKLYQQTLENLELPDIDYVAAFIPASSFCLITDKAAAFAGLKRLKNHLMPEAVVLIEFELPQPGDDWPKESSKTITNGRRQIRLVSQVDYDADQQLEIFTNVYELKQSGRVVQTENETLQLRCYSPEQMKSLLESAGFRKIQIQHPDFGWVAKARA